MSKIHTSLSPKANILLIVAEATVIIFSLFIIEPHVPIVIVAVGAALGAVGGVMQHLSIRDASSSLLKAATLMDVRRAIKATIWGNRFIYWIYFSKAALIALTIGVIRHGLINISLGYLAGYVSFMFIRELITLRDIFFLSRLTSCEISEGA